MISSRAVLFNFVLAILVCHEVALAQVTSSRVPSKPGVDDYLPIDDTDLQTVRKDIRFVQKQIIAANMKLTDTEAERFWPVYDRYISELDQIDDAKYELIKQDLETRGALSDADAESVAQRWVEIDRQVAQLRMKYIPSFRKVLSSKKTALFCQLERHVQLTIDMKLASALPVIEP